MVFDATLNNISVISQSVLVEETRVPSENHSTSLSQVTDKLLSHNVVSSTPRLGGIQTHNFSGDMH